MRHDKIGVYAAKRPMLAFLLAGLPVLLVPAPAATDLCGATILANVTLDQDLSCAGNGLTVGADGVAIDLNGHSITGAGANSGIVVSGRAHVSIFGGTVRNFAAGVLLLASTDVMIQGNELLENGDGIDMQAGSSGNTITGNAFRDNRARGIMLRGATTNNLVEANSFTGNRVGILLFAPTLTTVRGNIVSQSGLAGIRVNFPASNNLILQNTVTSNPTGIDFIITATAWPTGIGVVENTIAMNTCGLRASNISLSRFAGNVFQANGVDTCGP